MNRPAMEDGHVRMSVEEFEEYLELAAERGAKRALADVGLVDEEAASDIRDLRSLLGAVRIARHTAWQIRHASSTLCARDATSSCVSHHRPSSSPRKRD